MNECMHDPAFMFDGICSICHRQRRKLIALHANHLHKCGWCGEWYTGARVDHGCPAPDVELEADLEMTRRIWQTTTPEPY